MTFLMTVETFYVLFFVVESIILFIVGFLQLAYAFMAAKALVASSTAVTQLSSFKRRVVRFSRVC